MSCPTCNYHPLSSSEDCPVCGFEAPESNEAEWVMLGTIDDSMSADFAREVFISYDIPAVVISKSGYFGQFGLFFHGFHSGQLQEFEVSVPMAHSIAASELLAMTVGSHWHERKEARS